MVFHLSHRHQFVYQLREPLRGGLQFLLQAVLLPEMLEHSRLVAFPMRQNQAAQAVVVGHGLLLGVVVALIQPPRVNP
jgi:hypothetical protein